MANHRRIAVPSSTSARAAATAKTSFEATNPAATSAPEQTKLRREKMFFICISSPGGHCRILDMRCPLLLILPPPHAHCFRVVLNPSVFRVEMQLPVDFPRDVGKL